MREPCRSRICSKGRLPNRPVKQVHVSSPQELLVTNRVPESEQGNLAAEERCADPLEVLRSDTVEKNLRRRLPCERTDASTCVCFGSRAAVVAGLMVRPVRPQLRKCGARLGIYAWCQFRTSRSQFGSSTEGRQIACLLVGLALFEIRDQRAELRVAGIERDQLAGVARALWQNPPGRARSRRAPSGRRDPPDAADAPLPGAPSPLAPLPVEFSATA